MTPPRDRPVEPDGARAGVTMQGRLLLEILSSMAEAVLLADRHGVFQFANPAAEALLGEALMSTAPEEWTSELGLLDPATGRPLEREQLPLAIVLQGGVVDLRHIVVRRPGAEDRRVSAMARPIRDESGAMAGAVLVLRDITGRQTAIDALARSERRYREMFTNDLAGHFESTPEGRLLACNPAFARMFGFESVEAALSADMRSIYPAPQAREALLSRLRAEGRIEQEEAELRRVDGRPIWTIENTRGVFDDEGRLVEIHGSIIDITRYHEVERQLRHAQKMDAIGQLAAGVAHDFNNLLTVIAGYGDELLESPGVDERARECAREIVDAGRRAAGLTRQLLAFGRHQTMQPTLLDLNTVVAGIEPMLRRLIGERVTLRCALSSGELLVRADEGGLEQVLTNLVINARDAMPRGGTITLTTCVRGANDAELPAELTGQGPVACLAVVDTGVGMDAETLGRVFEPFFTTKPKGRGTGLGLSVAYGIVGQFGGAMAAESRPGEGSTFRVYVPLARGAPEPGTPRAPARPLSGGGATVLVADDDAGIRHLVKLVLARADYRVVEATDGAQALALIEGGGPVDVVVSDVVMPTLGGVALAQSLLVRHPTLPLVLMSGYPRGVEAEVVEHLAHLAKPFTPQQLLQKVHEALTKAKR